MTTEEHDPITPDQLTYLPDRELYQLLVASAVQWPASRRT